MNPRAEGGSRRQRSRTSASTAAASGSSATWFASGPASRRCASVAANTRSRKPSRIPSGCLIRSHRASETTTGFRLQSGAPSPSRTVGRAASVTVDPSVDSQLGVALETPVARPRCRRPARAAPFDIGRFFVTRVDARRQDRRLRAAQPLRQGGVAAKDEVPDAGEARPQAHPRVLGELVVVVDARVAAPNDVRASSRERHRPGCRLRVVEHNHVSGGETGR